MKNETKTEITKEMMEEQLLKNNATKIQTLAENINDMFVDMDKKEGFSLENAYYTLKFAMAKLEWRIHMSISNQTAKSVLDKVNEKK